MAERILIVDDIATNRIVLKVKLGSACYETLQAASGGEAIAMARKARPDLILLDVELPDMNGPEVCARLKADPLTRDIPVVMVTARHDEARRIESLRAGAAEVFWKPIDDSHLLARLRSLLRSRDAGAQFGIGDAACPVPGFGVPGFGVPGFGETEPGFEAPGHIAIVTPRLDRGLALRRDLARTTAGRVAVLDDTAALGLSAAGPVPDVFLVVAEHDRPEATLRLLSDLRSRPASRHSAVCLLLQHPAGSLAAIALDLGADDLIDGAAPAAEIALRLSCQVARKRRADRLRTSLADGLRLAVTDPLTGLHNRRYALPQLARMDEAARRSGTALAVMVLDLDRFKAVNDSFGHAAGDAVLVEVARRLRANLRPDDLAARIGGEEFVVAAAETSPGAARTLAERIRRAVEERPVRLPHGESARVTLSIGLAMGGAVQAAPSVDALLEAADRALLRSKTDGRNPVTVSRSAA
jgi:two-component system cell cycle response regulator